MAKSPLIRAAGVVLLRTSPESGRREVLLVHRPSHEDWSLPKGKVDEGEHVIAAAVRECDEETGFTPQLQAPLASHTYSVSGRPKVVHYWRALVRDSEGFAPDDEVDEVRWVPVDAADAMLTYPSDAKSVREACELSDSSPLIILRHTQALKRSDYTGELDIDRPLTGKGRTQAKSLVPLLDAFGSFDIHTSSAKRCADTVKKFAKHQGSPTLREDSLTEEGHRDHPAGAFTRAAEIAALPHPVLLCSHRPVLPTILEAVAEELGISPKHHAETWDAKLPPGGFLVIHRRVSAKGRMRVVAIERHEVTAR